MRETPGSAVLRDINFSGEIDLELSACDLQGSGLQGTEISISASTATISLSGLRGKLVWNRAWATPA